MTASLPVNFLVYSLDPVGDGGETAVARVATLEAAIRIARVRHFLGRGCYSVRWITRPGAIFSVDVAGEVHGRGETAVRVPHGTEYQADPMA